VLLHDVCLAQLGCREAIAQEVEILHSNRLPVAFESSVDRSRAREVVGTVFMYAHDKASPNKQAAGIYA